MVSGRPTRHRLFYRTSTQPPSSAKLARSALDNMLRKAFAWKDILRRSYSPRNADCQGEEIEIPTARNFQRFHFL